MAITNIEKKWILPIRDWGMILQQFLIIFEEDTEFKPRCLHKVF